MSDAPTPTACDMLKSYETTYLQISQNGGLLSIRDQNGESQQFSTVNLPQMLETMKVLQAQCTTYYSPLLGGRKETPRPISFINGYGPRCGFSPFRNGGWR